MKSIRELFNKKDKVKTDQIDEAYKQIFGGGNHFGNLIMLDLERRCSFGLPSYRPGSKESDAAFISGMQEVIFEIKKQVEKQTEGNTNGSTSK
jgi:hypothetical protein